LERCPHSWNTLAKRSCDCLIQFSAWRRRSLGSRLGRDRRARIRRAVTAIFPGIPLTSSRPLNTSPRSRSGIPPDPPAPGIPVLPRCCLAQLSRSASQLLGTHVLLDADANDQVRRQPDISRLRGTGSSLGWRSVPRPWQTSQRRRFRWTPPASIGNTAHAICLWSWLPASAACGSGQPYRPRTTA
jgi:hypothetical protein